MRRRDGMVSSECAANRVIATLASDIAQGDHDETTIREKVLIPCKVAEDIVL